jgi:hypothetical protein
MTERTAPENARKGTFSLTKKATIPKSHYKSYVVGELIEVVDHHEHGGKRGEIARLRKDGRPVLRLECGTEIESERCLWKRVGMVYTSCPYSSVPRELKV